MTAPALIVTPERALQPTPISIRATGLGAGTRVRLASCLVDQAGMEWRAHGWFVADAHGVVDVADAPSEEGTFVGIDPSGLIWSMQPPGGADRRFMIEAGAHNHKTGRPHFDDPLQPMSIELTAETDGEIRARATLVLEKLVDGIDVVPVHDGSLRGIAFRWRDRSRRRGAIMSLTGSGGGVEMSYAPLLSSQGYDVLSLAYFAYEDLPGTIMSLPLEYFEEGFHWMRREFGAETIAVQGASRGGELALILAAYFPEHVSGAIPIVPMYASSAGWDPKGGVAGASWTFRGREIPYAESHTPSLAEMKLLGEADPLGYAATPDYFADLSGPEVREHAAIPIERANGPILLISGDDDQMWPCRWGSDLVVNRLRAHGYAHPCSHLAMQQTGHWTPLQNSVTTFTRAIYHGLADVFLTCGGTPAGGARASWGMWQAITEHYRRVFS